MEFHTIATNFGYSSFYLISRGHYWFFIDFLHLYDRECWVLSVCKFSSGLLKIYWFCVIFSYSSNLAKFVLRLRCISPGFNSTGKPDLSLICLWATPWLQMLFLSHKNIKVFCCLIVFLRPQQHRCYVLLWSLPSKYFRVSAHLSSKFGFKTPLMIDQVNIIPNWISIAI